MNHAYRTVFNHARGAWQAVAETARAHGSGGRGAVALAAVAVLGTLSTAAWADNLLVGSGSINGGNGGNDYYAGGAGGGGIGGTTVTVASPATNADIGPSYDYVVIGSSGGGGGGNLYGNPGGSGYVGTTGAAGELSLNGFTLSVANDLRVGGFGGGGGGWGGLAEQGGQGGAGTLTLAGGATVTATGQTVLGGGSGNGGAAAGSAPGGAGGAGTLNLGGGSTLNANGGFAIDVGSTLNVGNATPNATTAGTLAGVTGFTNNGAINFNQSNATTFAAAIAGIGTVTQNSGTTTLTGANTYSGTTTVNGGTLTFAGGGTLGATNSGNVVVNGGTLDLGGTTQTKNATITLAGGTISNGTLSSSGLFDMQSGSASAVLAGTAALTKSGAGTVTLSGANTYAGATTIAAGTLKVGTGGTAGNIGAGAVTDNGVLAFERSDDVTVSNAISGSGVLNQLGAGKLILESSANTLGGGVNVNAGTLIVGGSTGSTAALTANVNVTSGATLGGHGAISGNVAVASGATLSPGNSIGTLTLGSLALASGANWRVELKDGGNTPGVHNDFVHVTGAASIANGVAIHVTPENGTDNGSTYAANTRYTLLTADGGLTVSGSQTITDDYAYLNFTSGFDTNHYYLTSTLAATSFCLPGQTKNQCTTGNGAFALGPGNPVYAALLNLNAAASGPALDQLSGLPYTFGNLLAFRAITGFHGLLNQRIGSDTSMQTAFEQLSNLRLAYNGDDLSGFVSPPEKDGFWIRALANDGRVNGDGNAAGADTSGGGVALGADRWLTPDLKAGVAFAYSRDRADVDNGLGSLALDSYQLAAYARWQNIAGTPGRYLNASIGYGIHKGEGNRDMALIGQRANGNYDADSYTASIEAGQNFASGQATLTPYVGLAAARVVRGDFSESGGAAALRIAGRTDNSLRSSVGLRAAWWTESLAPTVDMAWVHEYDDSQGGIDAGFAVAPATTRFGIVGPKLERDRLALKLGLTAWKDKTSRLDVGYNGEFASSDRNHMAAATFRWVW